MPSNEFQSAPKVAIYWDFENIHISIYEQEIGPFRPTARYQLQEALVDVSAIMDYASTVGRICINRAYCNWSFFARYQDALSGHGISLVQLFPRGQHGKNGADIQMCVDLVEDMLRLDVDVCIIVSGDSDFIGAVQKVRQYGKRVIGIGVRDCSNRFFQRVCDEFKFYDTLLQDEAAVPSIANESGDLTLDEAKRLLIAAVSRLAAQHGEPAVRKAPVKPMMLRLEPSFDERALGFATFSAFLDECRDVIEESVGEDDHTITLRGGHGEAPSHSILTSEADRDQARKLLVAAVTFLQRGRDQVPMAAVKVMMKKLEPGFDEKRTGAKTFLAFLQQFRDVVKIHGEAERRWVELLVPQDEGGHPSPVEQALKNIDALPSDEVIRSAIAFHTSSLRSQPATGWPDYYERMRAAIESDGFEVTLAQLQSLRRLLYEMKVFKMLPNLGGITMNDFFADEPALLAKVRDHVAQFHPAQPGEEVVFEQPAAPAEPGNGAEIES